MSEAKFTPGPWSADEDPMGPEILTIIANADRPTYEWTFIAQIGVDDDHTDAQGVLRAEAEANARLIAAAPDLYEALKEVSQAMTKLTFEGVDRGKGHWPAWDDTARAVDKARAALAKCAPQDTQP